jgi:hypothetical protein
MREVIHAIGLVNTANGKVLYGPDMVYMNHGGGTQGLYQIPDQIIRAMQTLAQHVQPRTYLEYGVFTGWNACLITAFLGRISHPIPLQAYAADITTKFIAPETLQIFSALNIKYIHSITELPDILAGARARHELIDVCFIDAVHTYRAVRRDYERMQDYCKVAMFHDIYDWTSWSTRKFNGGVAAFWAHLKANVRNSSRIIEIVDNRGLFPPSLGFGILLPNERGVAALDTPLTLPWTMSFAPLRGETLIGAG